jgi:hypothetical protein
MVTKTKNKISYEQKAKTAAANVGIVILSAATTLGMIDLPDHLRGQVLTPITPAFNFANFSNDKNNPVRRDSEDSAPQYVSYSVNQRTVARSGRR